MDVSVPGPSPYADPLIIEPPFMAMMDAMVEQYIGLLLTRPRSTATLIEMINSASDSIRATWGRDTIKTILLAIALQKLATERTPVTETTEETPTP